MTATFNFGSGLSTLVSHPRLYGWNWDYALQGHPVPPQSLSLLTKGPLVAAWSGVKFADVEIDGQTVPVLISAPHARVSPPVLSGHALEAGGQVVLGGATLTALHKRVGQRVSVSYGDRADAPLYVPPTSLVIVGTATPAQIENYRSSGAAPDLLAGSVALGAVVALGLSLVASVRRRRRDLALLKALGFTRAQLAWTVAWQSTIAVAIGVVAGLPVGTALGRWLWDLFARSTYTVPDAPVPALSLLLVAGAAFVLANAVAAFPGAYAARAPAALVLRAE